MAGRKVVHLEIFGRERMASAQFYADLFGWEVRDYPDMQYTMLRTGNQEIGIGVGQASDGQPALPTFYIESTDLQADLQAIRNKGGIVVEEPFEVPGVGWLAFFKDPAGNLIALGKFEEAQGGGVA